MKIMYYLCSHDFNCFITVKCIPLNRYFWLLNLIYTTGGISRDDINEQWSKSPLNEINEKQIPESTFHHWKKMIYREWGLQIQYDRARNVYYVDDGDVSGQNKFLNWMMNSISVAEVIRESGELKDRILLESMPSGERWLCTIIECMKNNVTFDMEYKRFDADSGHYMEFKPYCLKTFKQRWYVVGESSDHENQIRVYALDRVSNVIKGTRKFKMPRNFDGKNLFKDLYGVWLGTERKVERVRVRATEWEANYLRTLQLHESQKELGPSSTKGWIEFEWKIKVTPDFIMELRSHGKALQVLEPAWLKGEI